ncbi:hypothetical protein TWF718_003416 [Orbilia javanica]|uniref:C2H2-type domain-containing protein n=1 Tax=Orbilia javanica TaxID=47235 RepID=A0AAN8MLY7_9PEZI
MGLTYHGDEDYQRLSDGPDTAVNGSTRLDHPNNQHPSPRDDESGGILAIDPRLLLTVMMESGTGRYMHDPEPTLLYSHGSETTTPISPAGHWNADGYFDFRSSDLIFDTLVASFSPVNDSQFDLTPQDDSRVLYTDCSRRPPIAQGHALDSGVEPEGRIPFGAPDTQLPYSGRTRDPDDVIDSHPSKTNGEIYPVHWNGFLPIASFMPGAITELPLLDGFLELDVPETPSTQEQSVTPATQHSTIVVGVVPTTGPARQSSDRPTSRPDTTNKRPRPRLSHRTYKENRQRIKLGAVRTRIKCNIDGCPAEYATAGTVYRHRQNTHWSKGEFCAHCLYPGCQTVLRAGTGPKAWDNLRTHQNRKHSSWVGGKTKSERCEMTEHLKEEHH